MAVSSKRIYEPAGPDDGYRVLIDRLWPRGVSKEKAALDEWAKELAPSDDLRRWYGHDPAKYDEFERRYLLELTAERDRLEALHERARSGPVTIVFGARDSEHSNAAVLTPLLSAERLELPAAG